MPGGVFDLAQSLVLRKEDPEAHESYILLEGRHVDAFRKTQELAWHAILDALHQELVARLRDVVTTVFYLTLVDRIIDGLKPVWVERFFDQWAIHWPAYASSQYKNLRTLLGEKPPPINPSSWTAAQQNAVRLGVSQRVNAILETTKVHLRNGNIQTPDQLFEVAREEWVSRKKLIAVLEVAMMTSTATQWAADTLGAQRFWKFWLTMEDEKVRPTHQEQHRMRVSGEETFPNGCRYPQDPLASLSEILGCRCVAVYVAKEDYSENPLRSAMSSGNVQEVLLGENRA